MPYAGDRFIHDADAHVMETPEWIEAFAPRHVHEYLLENFSISDGSTAMREIDAARGLHADPAYRRDDEAAILTRKNWRATGSFDPADRSQALDLLGFRSQLVFPTLLTTALEALELSGDVELAYGLASAANRAQTAFCAGDPRLLPVAYVPLVSLERAPQAAAEAIGLGAAALLVSYQCPPDHAPSHLGLDAVWARAQEAGIPILLHVATPELVLPPQHRNNGLPPEPDFHGGGENFRSVSYMAIPALPMQTLSMWILDGVLERHPALKVGVIELGAAWVPSFMRQLDAGFAAFARHEQRLGKLSLKPSEYVRRQVRVTPYPTEPTRWIIEQSAPEVCLFSSDYPHVEGGRNPLKRFDREVQGLPTELQTGFFRSNFEDLMGQGLPAELAAS